MSSSAQTGEVIDSVSSENSEPDYLADGRAAKLFFVRSTTVAACTRVRSWGHRKSANQLSAKTGG